MLIRVGSAEIGGLIEVVEFKPARDLAWVSVTGVDQRGRWRIRDREGRARAGGAPPRLRRRRRRALGRAAERIAARTVSGHLGRSLRQLKRQVEHEQLRAPAAARRDARAA